MTATAIMALLSFPAFWANGYGLTQIGSAELPLGSMVSTLNGVTWFWFIALYVKTTKSLPTRPLAVQLWDWALVLLVVASAGAVGLAGLVMTGLSNIFLQQAFLHLFLDLFAVGWFTLAMLGLIWAHLGADSQPKWLPTQSLAIALAPTFILGMAPVMVTPRLFWPAVIANLIASGLLAVHLVALWQRRGQVPRLLHFAGLILAIHAVIALALVWPGVWRWTSSTSLRVFFLHNLLLGWTSTALLGLIWAGLMGKWGKGAKARQPAPNQIISWLGLGWLIGVAIMLLALLGLGFIQFLPIPARLLFQIAFWASLIVAGVAVVQLFVRVKPAE